MELLPVVLEVQLGSAASGVAVAGIGGPADVVLSMLLLAGTLGFLLVGLAPYDFDFTSRSGVRVLFLRPLNALLNFACFVPFGVIIGALSFVERPVLCAGCYCAGLSGVVEVLQLYLPSRFGSVSDWLLNTGGGVFGAAIVGAVGSD